MRRGPGAVLGRAALAAIAAGCLAGGAARAQEGAPGAVSVEPIVVTATRIPEKVSEQASSVTVVTRDEMEARLPAMAGDILQGIPGLDVQRSGSAGNLENAKIRGGLGTHTLVLIDGFPVNSPTLGEFDLSALPVDGFDRVEVVRGAQSALYGSNAIGGVVNFVPREARPGRAYGLGLAGGSFSSLKWSGFAEGGGKNGSLHVGAAGWESEGILPHDKTSLASFLASGSARVGDRSTAHAILFSTDERKEVPIDFGSLLDLNHVNTRRGLLGGARVTTALSPTLAVTVSGAVFDEFFDVNDPADPGQFYGFDSLTQTRKDDYEVHARWAPTPRAVTIVGAEYLRDRGTNDYSDPFGAAHLDLATYNRSLFLQQEFRAEEKAGLSLGARLDRNTEAGTEFSPRAAAFWNLGRTGVRLRASAGRGFRVPTLLEKFDPFVGNPRLSPETGRSYEAGFDARTRSGRAQMSAVWFYQQFRDLVQFVPGPFGPQGFGEMRNAARAFSRGVEAAAQCRLRPEAAVALSYTWSDTWDAASGRRLLGIPRQRGAASLLVQPAPRWEARLDWRIESDQLDAPPNGGDPRRPGYARLDAFARYRWTVPGSGVREVALTGRAGNLLDRRYEERKGYPAPRFNFLLGAEVSI